MVLALAALLVMTLRFPPADLSGVLAHALGLPVASIILLCAVMAALGLIAARRAQWHTGVVLNAVIGSVAAITGVWVVLGAASMG